MLILITYFPLKIAILNDIMYDTMLKKTPIVNY